MRDPTPTPTIQFFRFVESGRPPIRADRAAGGTLPTRAFRYCEAMTTAAALGCYVFPPIGFKLYWTGKATYWTYAGVEHWYLLRTAQFPNFRKHFDSVAPDEVKTYSPTFLAALPEPGIIQIWSGLIAKTKPGWSLVVRRVTNLPGADGYDLFEGVIEADQWFGPLFINIRLERTGCVIEFDPSIPLFQVQPIPREAYSDAVLDDVEINGLADLDTENWKAYQRTVVQPSQRRCPLGTQAAAVRRRRHSDMAGVSVEPSRGQEVLT